MAPGRGIPRSLAWNSCESSNAIFYHLFTFGGHVGAFVSGFFYQSLQSMIWVFVAPSRDRCGSIASSPSLSPNSIAGISRHLTRLTQRVRLGGPPLHPHLHFLKLFFFPVTDGGPRVIFCLENGSSRQNSLIEKKTVRRVASGVFGSGASLPRAPRPPLRRVQGFCVNVVARSDQPTTINAGILFLAHNEPNHPMDAGPQRRLVFFYFFS